MKLEKVIDIIKTDCSDILRYYKSVEFEPETLLYSGKGVRKDKILIDNFPTNRSPLGSTLLNHQIMINVFKKAGAIANRDNSFFVTGTVMQAREYTKTNLVYVVFPPNGFYFTYSDYISDFFMYFINDKPVFDINIPEIQAYLIFQSPLVYDGFSATNVLFTILPTKVYARLRPSFLNHSQTNIIVESLGFYEEMLNKNKILHVAAYAYILYIMGAIGALTNMKPVHELIKFIKFLEKYTTFNSLLPELKNFYENTFNQNKDAMNHLSLFVDYLEAIDMLKEEDKEYFENIRFIVKDENDTFYNIPIEDLITKNRTLFYYVMANTPKWERAIINNLGLETERTSTIVRAIDRKHEIMIHHPDKPCIFFAIDMDEYEYEHEKLRKLFSK